MTKLFLLCFAFCCASAAQAQSISISLPKYGGQTVYIAAAAGVKYYDTLGSVVLNSQGKGTFTHKLAAPAIAAFCIKEKFTWSFVASPHENISIQCADEFLTPENVYINNSPENDAFQRWNHGLAVQREQKERGRQLAQMYNGKEPVAVALNKEQQRLSKSMALITDTINRSSLYAAAFFRLDNFLNQYGNLVGDAKQDTAICEIYRQYFRDTLNMEVLYGSTKWRPVIINLLALYRQKKSYQEQGLFYNDFVSDMCVALARIENAEVYRALANDLLSVCEELAWDRRRDELLNFITASKRISNPTPLMKKLLETKQLKIGGAAPEIWLSNGKSFTSIPADKYLVVFYESGCPHCEKELQTLKTYYEQLKAQNIAVLTVSADKDQKVYETTSGSFPWQSLCDLKGKEGNNFKNYGVVGTPSIFLIDKNKKVAGKYGQLEELGFAN